MTEEKKHMRKRKNRNSSETREKKRKKKARVNRKKIKKINTMEVGLKLKKRNIFAIKGDREQFTGMIWKNEQK